MGVSPEAKPQLSLLAHTVEIQCRGLLGDLPPPLIDCMTRVEANESVACPDFERALTEVYLDETNPLMRAIPIAFRQFFVTEYADQYAAARSRQLIPQNGAEFDRHDTQKWIMRKGLAHTYGVMQWMDLLLDRMTIHDPPLRQRYLIEAHMHDTGRAEQLAKTWSMKDKLLDHGAVSARHFASIVDSDPTHYAHLNTQTAEKDIYEHNKKTTTRSLIQTADCFQIWYEGLDGTQFERYPPGPINLEGIDALSQGRLYDTRYRISRGDAITSHMLFAVGMHPIALELLKETGLHVPHLAMLKQELDSHFDSPDLTARHYALIQELRARICGPTEPITIDGAIYP